MAPAAAGNLSGEFSGVHGSHHREGGQGAHVPGPILPPGELALQYGPVIRVLGAGEWRVVGAWAGSRAQTAPCCACCHSTCHA